MTKLSSHHTGYNVTATPFWLCRRPECLVVLKLSDYRYGPLVPVSWGEVKCVICRRTLQDMEGL